MHRTATLTPPRANLNGDRLPRPKPGRAMCHPMEWMTRQDAAAYLRVSVDWIDGRLIRYDDHPKADKGKFRCLDVDGGARGMIRILAADVYAVLPLVRGEEEI